MGHPWVERQIETGDGGPSPVEARSQGDLGRGGRPRGSSHGGKIAESRSSGRLGSWFHTPGPEIHQPGMLLCTASPVPEKRPPLFFGLNQRIDKQLWKMASWAREINRSDFAIFTVSGARAL